MKSEGVLPLQIPASPLSFWKRGVREGRSPSPENLPLSLIGEGDTGGEVD